MHDRERKQKTEDDKRDSPSSPLDELVDLDRHGAAPERPRRLDRHPAQPPRARATHGVEEYIERIRAGEGLTQDEIAMVREQLARIDDLIAIQLAEVLSHPEFYKLTAEVVAASPAPERSDVELLRELTREQGATSPLAALVQAAVTVGDEFVRDLAVPHWFDEQVVRALHHEPHQVVFVFQGLLQLPFVSVWPSGCFFHPEVRQSLRGDLIRRDQGRYRVVSRKLARIFSVASERMYNLLAWDENGGLLLLDELFDQALDEGRVVSCKKLLDVAEEQALVLSSAALSEIAHLRDRLRSAVGEPTSS